MKKRSGLTIYEIILSVAIVAIASVVLIRVFVSANELNNRAEKNDAAVFAAVTAAEKLDYQAFEELILKSAGLIGSGNLTEIDGLSDSHGLIFKFKGGRAVCELLESEGLIIRITAEFKEQCIDFNIDAFDGEEPVYSLEKKLHYRTTANKESGGGNED